MATAQRAEEEAGLQIRRVFDAPREKVFQAWTDPRAITAWFGPHELYRCSVDALDLRVGGRYSSTMTPPEGESGCAGDTGICRVGGVYTRIEPPAVLAFTFSWEEGGMDVGETLVMVELTDLNGRTELVLTHERLPHELARTEHHRGWSGSLDRLGRFVV